MADKGVPGSWCEVSLVYICGKDPLLIVSFSTDVLAPYLPTKPRCMEIFARYLLPGWTSWGCEVLKLQHLSLYKDRDHEN
jgi:hypothetical protein